MCNNIKLCFVEEKAFFVVGRERMCMEVLDVLVEVCLEQAGSYTLDGLRVGLGYTCAAVSGDEERSAGLAATLLHDMSPRCTQLKRAGGLAGLPLDEVLAQEPKTCTERAVVLACCNALLNRNVPEQRTDVLASELSGKDVGMVGLFASLVPEMKRMARSLVIVEKNEALASQGVVRDITAVSDCDVVLVSSSTIVNDTVDDVLSACGGAVVMLGASTPMSFSVFPDHVSVLAGRAVVDIEGAMRVVSEGGGTPALSKHTRKLTLKR